MEDKLVRELYQNTLAQEQRHDLLTASAIDRERGQNVLQEWHFQACREKCLFDAFPRAFLFSAHGHASSNQPNLLALDCDLLSGRELGEQEREEFLSNTQSLSQSFFGNATDERICFVKLLQEPQELLCSI